MSPSRILIVLNPAAGRARRHVIDNVASLLREQGRQVDIHETRGPGDASTVLPAMAAAYDVIVAAGGDGTVNEVLNGLRDHPDISLGIIPCGTTNVLATELGLPNSPARIAAMLMHGKTRTIYPGSVNGHRFGMMVGVGYDAWVVQGVDAALKKKIGKLAYVLSMLRELRHFGQQRYRLELDGQVHEAGSAVLTLGRHYAGSYILARDACIDVAEMDVVLVQTRSAAAFLLMLFALPLGLASRLPFMKTVKAKSARITLMNGQGSEGLQADGDMAGSLPASVTVSEQPLRVLVPAR
ncbi:MAG: diacylglycerol kinase family lipid kinase [Pedobacter sp.]|nr:diacylglycerol kinase family lipid kinase [Pedobacter sp.]